MTLIEKDNISESVTIYEVEFKGSRKDYFICPDNLSVKVSDQVIVQADRGEHIGCINRRGTISMFPYVKELKSIIRHSTYTDMQIMMDNKDKEEEALKICQGKIAEHGLNMKLVDVEYQFDGNKICFYFTAEKRIDFRSLVKDLAAEYRTRIELRQIGVRDEARRLGGIGVCGRSLCCKTFLSQFEPITSQMARDQNLSLSPSKISGLCGRLMCCLAYEEDFYKDQLGVLPAEGVVLEKEGVQYKVTKVDILNENFVIRGEDGDDQSVGLHEFAEYKVVGTVQNMKPAADSGDCENCEAGCKDIRKDVIEGE